MIRVRRLFSFRLIKPQQLSFLHHNPDKSVYDVVVVGGGIVGVSTARELLGRYPNLKVALVEKETRLAVHQTGHNSGVIHAGIYYTPGSLKAKLCVQGMKLTYTYMNMKGIPYKKVGKLIVATTPVEVPRLDELLRRGLANGVPGLEVVDRKGIREIEPNCTGLKGLWSPETGIVDYACVTYSLARDFEEMGGDVFLDYKVKAFIEGEDCEHPVVVVGQKGQRLSAKCALSCGGLHSDVLAQMTGCEETPKIIPFRGEYLKLAEHKQDMVSTNIYPVPDPAFPFLGVHFTPRMDGSIWLGPNAVLAFKKEGYDWSSINLKELYDILTYPGFRKLAFKYPSQGINQITKSWITHLQVRDLQRMVPCIRVGDVVRGSAGVRAQALAANGSLVDDFVFDKGKSKIGRLVLHCRNAPSPGATSSQAIAKMIADRMHNEFNLFQDYE